MTSFNDDYIKQVLRLYEDRELLIRSSCGQNFDQAMSTNFTSLIQNDTRGEGRNNLIEENETESIYLPQYLTLPMPYSSGCILNNSFSQKQRQGNKRRSRKRRQRELEKASIHQVGNPSNSQFKRKSSKDRKDEITQENRNHLRLNSLSMISNSLYFNINTSMKNPETNEKSKKESKKSPIFKIQKKRIKSNANYKKNLNEVILLLRNWYKVRGKDKTIHSKNINRSATASEAATNITISKKTLDYYQLILKKGINLKLISKDKTSNYSSESFGHLSKHVNEILQKQNENAKKEYKENSKTKKIKNELFELIWGQEEK